MILIIMVVVLAGGCSATRPPEVQVSTASLVERTDDAAAISVDLALSNSNTDPLQLQEFQYSLRVGGRTVYTARRAALATLPPGGGGSRIVLPGVVRYDQVGWSSAAMPEVVDWSISGTMTYLAPGSIAEILFEAGVRKPSVDFAAAGRLAVDGGNSGKARKPVN